MQRNKSSISFTHCLLTDDWSHCRHIDTQQTNISSTLANVTSRLTTTNSLSCPLLARPTHISNIPLTRLFDFHACGAVVHACTKVLVWLIAFPGVALAPARSPFTGDAEFGAGSRVLFRFAVGLRAHEDKMNMCFMWHKHKRINISININIDMKYNNGGGAERLVTTSRITDNRQQ